eukprot:9688-Heterococcus_DN1.PRE.2
MVWIVHLRTLFQCKSYHNVHCQAFGGRTRDPEVLYWSRTICTVRGPHQGSAFAAELSELILASRSVHACPLLPSAMKSSVLHCKLPASFAYNILTLTLTSLQRALL